MRAPTKASILTLLLFFPMSCLNGQESYYDALTSSLLDSLDQRIHALENQIPRLAESRATNYYFAKRDLDFTLFLKHYHSYVFDELLDKAEYLVDSRIKGAQKRRDKIAVDFYKDYKQKLKFEISAQQQRYQALFEKEKTFKKEFHRFVDKGDEYSLKRAQRMTDLALKYAMEKNYTSVYGFLHHYKSYIYSLLYDYYSEYDLAKLTQSDAAFQKVFKPLVESDELEMIQKAGKLVDHCYNYSFNISANLDTSYFSLQKNIIACTIADFYAREGKSGIIDGEQRPFLLARLDTLVKEGIYRWQDKIVVVGNFEPEARSENVRKGEAIINADRKLIDYLLIKKLAKEGKKIKMSYAYLIPYSNDHGPEKFMYNSKKRCFQYIVCYPIIESEYFTKRLGQSLPPLEFRANKGSL